LNLLKQTVLFTEDDEISEKLEKCWQTKLMHSGYVVPLLVLTLIWRTSALQTTMIDGYLATVRKRFYQWILDTCNRSYDQTWLDYQQEIGLRHTYAKKIKPTMLPLCRILDCDT